MPWHINWGGIYIFFSPKYGSRMQRRYSQLFAMLWFYLIRSLFGLCGSVTFFFFLKKKAVIPPIPAVFIVLVAGWPCFVTCFLTSVIAPPRVILNDESLTLSEVRTHTCALSDLLLPLATVCFSCFQKKLCAAVIPVDLCLATTNWTRCFRAQAPHQKRSTLCSNMYFFLWQGWGLCIVVYIQLVPCEVCTVFILKTF